MICVSFFKISFTKSDVFFGCIIFVRRYQRCFIYYICGHAFIVHWAVFFNLAVTEFLVFFVICRIYDLLIVGTYDGLDVRHAAVTYFDGIFVEDFVEFTVFREVFFN